MQGANTNSTTTLVSSIKNGNDTLAYTYDELGNITSVSENGTVIESYTYDDLNQLKTVTRGNDVYTYNYDNGGNILSVTKNGTTTRTYTYGNSQWKDQLTAVNGNTITYDAIGNPLTYYDGSTFTWADGRKLTNIANGTNNYSYQYDSNGLRASKNVNGTVTEYYWLDGTLYAEKTGNRYIYFHYDDNGIAYGFMVNDGTTTADYYYIHNLQGDVIGIVDNSGTKVVEYTYDEWGKLLTTTGTLATTIGTLNPFRYRGYYYDTETGFYYCQSRYYDPEISRWINADGYVSTGQDITGYNMFAYCGNNPINRADQSGNFWVVVVGVILATALISSLSSCSSNYPPDDYQVNTSPNHNCYSYAFDLPRAANPGDFSISPSDSNYMLKHKNIYTPEEITYFVLRDMEALGKSVRVVDSPSDKLENEYIVAMKTSDMINPELGAADYHFAVQLSDGTWADKLGESYSRWNKIDGTAIAWDSVDYIGYYNTKSVYFAVEK